MGRKPKDDTSEDVKDFGDRPEIADELQGSNLETLSHNWQKDSPAVDMRDASKPLVNVENLVDKINQEAKEEKAPAAEKVPADEYKARTKLDVSDPKYINPSLDHHTVEK